MGKQTHPPSVTKLEGNRVVSFTEPYSASLGRELKLDVGIGTKLMSSMGVLCMKL